MKSGAARPLAALCTMGCRLNHAESARIAGALEAAGWEVRAGGGAPPPDADAYLLHSCAVTAEAEKEALRRVRAAARAAIPIVAVSGCAASVARPEAWRDAGATLVLSRRAPPVPEPLPGAPESEIFAFAADSAQRGGNAAEASFASVRAPVKIQDGCSFRCSYCIVPDARGAPRSRPAEEVLGECRSLVARGYREIVLTGVNAACWRDGAKKLPELVAEAAALPGIARIRLGSVEPGTCEREIARLAAESGGKVCAFVHLPLQSGSDAILRAMRRHCGAAEFRAAARAVLGFLPRVGLGTDVIAGFPGETEEDFGLTVSLLEELPFSNVHAFPYSERPGTPAASMPDRVPVRTRRERARILAGIGREKRAGFAAGFVGREVEVLVERVERDGTGSGWTGEYLRASIPGLSSGDVGSLVRVRAAAAAGPAGDLLECLTPVG